MRNKKPAEMSDEELLKMEKTTKMTTYILGTALLLLFVLNIIVCFRKGFNAAFVIPIALLPVLTVNINSLKTLQQEKKQRKLS